MAIAARIATQLAVGSFNATSTASGANWGVEANTFEINTLADIEFERFANGRKAMAISFPGYNDFAGGAWDEYSRANFGSQQIVTLAYDGATAGTGAVIANGIMPAKQSFSANIGDAPAININIVGSTAAAPFGEGLVTRASTTNITGTTATTAVQVGALTAAQTVAAAVHVFAFSGTGTITCQLQSSATSGGSYTNRGSAGAAISAAGAQWISATGLTVTDTWWRLNVTASASPVATVLASIAIITP